MSKGDKQRVLDALSSSVEEIRHQAVRRLPEVFDQVPEDPLMQALGDASWRVRKGVLLLLDDLQAGPELLRRLVCALGEADNVGFRNAASEALIRFGEASVPALLVLLAEGDEDERKFAADILGNIGSNTAAEGLIQAIRDEDSNVRASACEALGRLGPDDAVPALTQTLSDGDLLVRLSCLDALVRLEAKIETGLLIPLFPVAPLRPALYRLLARSPDVEEAREQLLQALLSRSRSERYAAAQALVALYEGADRRQQVEIRVALTRFSADPELVDHLRSMLRRGDEMQQAAAMVLLGWTGQSEIVPDLIEAAVDDRSLERAREALLAIGPRAVSAMLDAFDGAGQGRQVLILNLLGHFKRPKSLSHIVEACLGSEVEVAEAAQRALGMFGDPSVIPTIVSLLSTGQTPLPRGAIDSLIHIGGRYREQVFVAVEPLLAQEGTRPAAAEVLCGISHKEEIDVILRLLNDGQSQVRVAAIGAIGRLGGDELIGRISTALTDEHASVRVAAAAALGLRNSEQAQAALRVALGDENPWVVKEAISGLARGADPQSMAQMQDLVLHPHGLVAREAVKALADTDLKQDRDLWLRASRHPDSDVVKQVIASSMSWPEETREAILFSVLDDERWDVRIAAVRSLVDTRNPEAMQALARRLEREDDALVREALEAALRPPA